MTPPVVKPDSTAQHGNLVRSAGVVSAAVLLSRLTGLAREIAMVRLFGAGVANDAFIVGFRLPNLMRDLFAEGALSSAFVPTFTSYLARSKEEAAHLANLVATALFVIVGAICAAGMIWSPQRWRCSPGSSPKCPENSTWPSR